MFILAVYLVLVNISALKNVVNKSLNLHNSGFIGVNINIYILYNTYITTTLDLICFRLSALFYFQT